MFYDYIITQFYPSIPWLVFIHICICIVSFFVYIFSYQDSRDKVAFIKKWKWRFITFFGIQVFMLCFYFWIPDAEYVKYFYGDVRVVEITPQQKAELQAQYDKHYERSKQLLLDCLEKGQKQPHTTTFNDTNEVIKTCYNVAKYKF